LPDFYIIKKIKGEKRAPLVTFLVPARKVTKRTIIGARCPRRAAVISSLPQLQTISYLPHNKGAPERELDLGIYENK